ncbi:MAG TPA: glycosyltransferase 87 family protein [Stellaceae bacterium]|nr:glycosyltransferase 87 family protein [Stellaceae bacterium]
MLRIVAAEFLVSLAVLALQEVPRGHGLLTLAGVALLIGALPLLLRGSRVAREAPPRWFGRALGGAVALFAVAQLVFAIVRTVKPKVLDIATTTVAAVGAVAQGGNPYALPIDPLAGGIAGVGAAFHGYKYLPAMLLAYAPLVLPLGVRGTVVTNILLQGATAAALAALAARRGGRIGGLAAALFYLSLPFPAHQLFTRGVNDLAAVLPLLLALLLIERRPGWAGLMAGLSIAAKLMPGLVVLPCLLPARGRGRFALGLCAGLLPILPFAAATPAAFADNILLFNLLRPIDDTSWLWHVPAAAAPARGIAVLALAVLYGWVWARQPEPDTRAAAAALAILVVLLAGPDMHHNYYLWFIPLFTLLAARAATGRPREAG